MRKLIFNNLEKSKTFKTAINKIKARRSLSLSGLTYAAKFLLLAYLVENTEFPLFFVTADSSNALRYLSDIEKITGKAISILPSEGISKYEMLYSETYNYAEQLKELRNFKNGTSALLISTYKNFFNKLPTEKFFKENSIELNTNSEIDLKKLTKKLVEIGYKRSTMVSDIGEFSQRGDILDIYPLNSDPIRIELWGDNVEDIRLFNIETQKSFKQLQNVTIEPRYKVILNTDNIEIFKAKLNKTFEQQSKDLSQEALEALTINYDSIRTSLETLDYFEGIEYFFNMLNESESNVFDFLPDKTIIIIDEYSEISSKIEIFDENLKNEYEKNTKEGLTFSLDKTLHYSKEYIFSKLRHCYTAIFDNFISDNADDFIDLETRVLPKFPSIIDFCDFIDKQRQQNFQIVIATEYSNRVAEILKDYEIPFCFEKEASNGCNIIISEASISHGFLSEESKFILLTDSEIFNKKAKSITALKKRPNKEKQEFIESINDIKEGDYVVHLVHGIGKYIGLSKQQIDGEYRDYLTIEYSNGDKLHMPAEQINLLCRYRGSGTNAPSLSKMGGSDWHKTKSKVKDAVEEVANELLKLYAKRAKTEGIEFLPDTNWQLEMEENFEYTETPDQLNAIIETKQDMESEKPMDRLICGDVGFGKTEIAIRAIFKAVMSGKQAAVMVPTTILAQQHFNVISERFKPYPIKIGLLSRFKTQKEQKAVVNGLITHEYDIVVGTHRLLQGDIQFKDLGLLVVDEEHRFGVRHKERIKMFKSNVDVLTMSATPIPRTLYMSMSGIKEMSIINTPPVNRAPIKTSVGEYNPNYIKTAINHELDREGQVYFLYNRVQSIHKMANDLKELVPQARIAVAHGQMNEKELEQVMLDFSQHEYDILLCTTIIESGLDIPNANTIIIYDAEKFGLAQLYQLRGRVGRSERQAYCYCCYRKDKILTDDARSRLLAIKDFTTLGSGYQIAMRDIEIRGVGNILGTKQHGHMISVGFDTYCSLLEDTINEIKGDKVDKPTVTIVDINVTAFIPDEWTGSKDQKMIEYKRLADVKSIKELQIIEEEWKDRFGDMPESVINLTKLIQLRLLASELKITQIRETPDNIRIYTPFQAPEWRLIAKNMPQNITKYIKFTIAPSSCTDANSILLLNNANLLWEELFNMFVDLFYYINKVKLDIHMGS